MCVATAAAIAAAGAAAIGAVGAIRAGNSQANADKYNALVQRQNADAATAAANAEASQRESLNARRTSNARAAFGASGVDPNSGTPLAVMSDLASQGELSKRLILYQGALQSRGLDQAANLSEAEGKEARTAGYFNAASTLLTGGARIANSYVAPKPSGTY